MTHLKLVPNPKEGVHQTRRFFLQRDKDISGVSGTGIVADGVEFDNGPCIIRWRGPHAGLEVVADSATLMAIHGHEGATRIEWLDTEEVEA